eukprot:15193748-Ditylum_brightwellii.AAC.1
MEMSGRAAHYSRQGSNYMQSDQSLMLQTVITASLNLAPPISHVVDLLSLWDQFGGCCRVRDRGRTDGRKFLFTNPNKPQKEMVWIGVWI